MSIPLEMSLTEFAELTGLTRKAVVYRAERGALPTRRINPKSPRSKRVVLLSTLQLTDPELWQAIVLRCQLARDEAA